MNICQVGTNEFRDLDWKEQLEIVKIKVFDPDRYNREILSLIYVDAATQKLIEDLEFLVREEARSVPTIDGFAISIVPHWIACDCVITGSQQEKLLEKLRVPHRYFINTHILKVPFIIADLKDLCVIDMIEKHDPSGFDLFKTKTFIDVDLKGDYNPDMLMNSMFLASKKYRFINHLIDLIGIYPVVNPSEEHAENLANDFLLIYADYGKEAKGCAFFPMLPRKLNMQEDFRFAGWHFLL